MTSAVVTAATKSVGEDRPPGIAKSSAKQNGDVLVPHVKSARRSPALKGPAAWFCCSGHDRELS